MSVADQQSSFWQSQEFGFGRFTEGAIGTVDDLFVPDSTVKRGTAIAEDFAIDLRAELLRAEEHDVEVAASSGDIDQRIAKATLATGGSMFVQLVDKHDQFANAEFLVLSEFPDTLDDIADDQLLYVAAAPGDINDPDLLIREWFVDPGEFAEIDLTIGQETGELCR